MVFRVFPSLTVRSLILAFILGLSLPTFAQKTVPGPELVKGKPIEREMAGGQTHTYRVKLSAGDYLHAVVDQRGVDVVVKVFGPNGQQVMEVDSPSGSVGEEAIYLIAKLTGEYLLEVKGLYKNLPRGKYNLRLEALHIATAVDQHRVVAEEMMSAAWETGYVLTRESLEQGVKLYENAIEHWRAISDESGESQALIGIGQLYRGLGDKQQALEFYQRALVIVRRTKDHSTEINALGHLGSAYYDLDQAQKAIDSFRSALSLARATGNRKAIASSLASLVSTYSRFGVKSGIYYNYLKEALNTYRSLKDFVGEDRMRFVLASYHKRRGEGSRAIAYFQQILSRSRSVGDIAMEARVFLALGYLYLDTLHDLYKAQSYFHKAFLSGQQRNDLEHSIQALIGLGKMSNQSMEFVQAKDYFVQALTMSQRLKWLRENGLSWYGLAWAEMKLGESDLAFAHSRAACEAHNSIQAGLGSVDLQVAYAERTSPVCELYRDLLMRRHAQEPTIGHHITAFELAERSRARGLLTLLAESRANLRQNLAPQLREEEHNLREAFNTKATIQQRLLSSKKEKEAKQVEKELEHLITQYQELLERIRASNPRYAALTLPTPVTIPEIQQQVLDQDTLLLEYALGEERSYLWAVTSQSITSFALPKRAEIEAQAKRVYELLTVRGKRIPGETAKQHLRRIARADAKFPAAAARLSEVVLGPVANQLGSKRLLIVADGALHYIPFAALPSPKGQDSLISNHEIVALPSASVLLELRRNAANRAQAPKTLAVLADPVFTRNDVRVRASTAWKIALSSLASSQEVIEASLASAALTRSAKESGLEFVRLRASRQEATAAAALVPASERQQALDFEANRTTALSEELNQYRMLHFATHGLLNSAHPELSGLVFSLVDKEGREQAGFVRLQDIYNMNLSADLVVLSACQTALGKEVRGEGLIGLTRGFMYAGSTRVMASLWRVDDQETAKLMGEFYRRMLGEERMTAAAALRKAQLMLKEEGLEPYYWAGFTLQGEWR